MAIKKRKVIIVSAIAAVVAMISVVVLYEICSCVDPHPFYPTYFSYTSAELESLGEMDSDNTMTIDDLFEWEDLLFDLVSEEKITRGSAKNILKYLLVAQRDAAYLSSNAHQEFRGSIDPVSREVACLYIPDVCQEIPVETDEYSELLATIVLRKVEAWMSEASSVLADVA